MAHSSSTPLDRQITRVRRRLFLQTFVQTLIWSWVAALALAVGWFLVQPLLLSENLLWVRWWVFGGVALTATVAAVVVAVRRAPSAVAAALSLDDRFALRERAVTSLMLEERERASSAGQALLADAGQRVERLRVGDRFPVRVPWTAALVPAFAVVLGLLAYFYNPTFGAAQDPAKEKPEVDASAKAAMEQKFKKIQQDHEGKKEDRSKSLDMQKIQADVDRMAERSRETKDEVRKRLEEAAEIEKEIKKQDQELADRARAVKDELKQLQRLNDDKDKKSDGPAQAMEDALKNGDLQAAKQEAADIAKKLENQEKMDELKKKIDDPKTDEKEKQDAQDELKKREKDGGLTKDEQQKLEKQLQEMQDRADQLSKNKDEKADELKKAESEGKISKEQLDRELEQLDKNEQQLQKEKQDLKDLAQELKGAQQALKEGKDGEAAQLLKKAGDQMDKLDGDQERQDLAKELKDLKDTKQAMAQALDDAQKGNNGQQPGDGQANNDPQKGPGSNQGNPASGARPEGKDQDTKHQDQHSPSQLDDKGKITVVGKAPGEGFKGPKKPAEMTEEIRRAAQEGAEATDRERLPKSAADMTRGFFEKMRPPDRDAPKKDK